MSRPIHKARRPAKSNEAGEPLAAPTIMLLAALLRRGANVAYKQELGLTSIVWGLIARLGEDGPMTQAEIAEKYMIDKGQLSRTAVALARKGLIRRKSKTWRSIELRLAPKGQVVFAEIRRISLARHRALLQGVGRHELKVLFKVLSAISLNATALLNAE